MARTTLRKVKSALNSLPEGLDRTYDQVMHRILAQDPEHTALALKILGWIHCAARPLESRELQHALAVEPGDPCFDEDGIPDMELVLSVCTGMVTIRENGTMGLVHYTAQEYFERNSSKYFSDAHTDIAQTCLTYVSFDEFAQGACPDDEAFDLRLEKYPLLQYASQNWAHYARGCPETPVKASILDFLKDNPKVLSSVQAMQVAGSILRMRSQNFTHGVQALWVAASEGLYDVSIALLDGGAEIEAKDSAGQRSLHRAAINGFDDVVLLLLEHQAEIEAKCDLLGRTPLQWAAFYGHRQVVQLLLTRGAIIGTQDRRGWFALHLAASNGHADVIRFLLDHGADMEAKDGYGASALYRAAESGHQESTQLLIDSGAQLDIKNDYDQTALHRAADLGHLSVTKILLEHGANIGIKDFYGWTAQYRAADGGHEDVAELLSHFASRKGH